MLIVSFLFSNVQAHISNMATKTGLIGGFILCYIDITKNIL